MVISAVLRKSITDLTRRRARAFFTVLTLALAVASVGLLAVSPLMEQAMLREVDRNRLPDVTVSMAPVDLDRADLEALRALPNVAAVEPRAMFPTRVWDGKRRERAVVVGVADFARQSADVVHIADGTAPPAGSVLTDVNNERQKGFDAQVGDVARVVGADGATRELAIAGTARNLTGGEDDPANDWVALYVSMQTMADLSGATGFTTLGLRLDDASPPAVQAAVAAVREELRARTPFTAFEDLPVVNEPGSYPGKESFENLASLLNIVTLLALLSALVLLSNTMTTLVSEQTAKIAAMKAIGARRRDVRRIYLRTAVLFGVLGAVLGAALGVLIANAVVDSFADMFFGVEASFGVSVPVVVACALVGVVGPPLAALPAVRRAARLPLGEALQASGSASAARAASTRCCAGPTGCRARSRSACAAWDGASAGRPPRSRRSRWPSPRASRSCR
ncbi:MAG TPA: ABC transporter permease [Baekduia sp.]|nr:ABC transporter permease [Baekduia sp.]